MVAIDGLGQESGMAVIEQPRGAADAGDPPGLNGLELVRPGDRSRRPATFCPGAPPPRRGGGG